MALTLGFLVVFFAGLAVAYFAGLQAARGRIQTVPARSPATSRTDVTARSNLDAAAAVAPAASEQSTVGANANSAASQVSGDENDVDDSDSFDTRKFRRSTFSGTAVATIYPPKQQAGSEPIRCEVLTRDLSCGGIGIAHTERLMPQQMVVLDAVGKLLVSEVRWCRRLDNDLYVAGCRLIKAAT